jgi:CheY-like chemotaxis protein
MAAAEASRFDLVLSDLGLPDGSGLDLMRHLRDRYGLAGIALTGYGMEEDIRRGREAGFVDHLVKPITFQKLADAIERFFAARSPA